MRTDKEETIHENRVLYDRECLERLHEQHGNAFEIKSAVDTTAKVYEIRTALRCWFGGEMDYRTSDRIEGNVAAFKSGDWTLAIAPGGETEVVPT